MISKGDKASARLKYRGTHRGELFGIAPTGKLARYAGAAVFTFRGDQIAEVWVLGDICGLISANEKHPEPISGNQLSTHSPPKLNLIYRTALYGEGLCLRPSS